MGHQLVAAPRHESEGPSFLRPAPSARGPPFATEPCCRDSTSTSPGRLRARVEVGARRSRLGADGAWKLARCPDYSDHGYGGPPVPGSTVDNQDRRGTVFQSRLLETASQERVARLSGKKMTARAPLPRLCSNRHDSRRRKADAANRKQGYMSACRLFTLLHDPRGETPKGGRGPGIPEARSVHSTRLGDAR